MSEGVFYFPISNQLTYKLLVGLAFIFAGIIGSTAKSMGVLLLFSGLSLFVSFLMIKRFSLTLKRGEILRYVKGRWFLGNPSHNLEWEPVEPLSNCCIFPFVVLFRFQTSQKKNAQRVFWKLELSEKKYRYLSRFIIQSQTEMERNAFAQQLKEEE